MADDGSFTPMQAQMGLAGPTSFSPSGIATPGPIAPMPYVRHPSEMAQQIGMQTQAIAMQSISQAQMTRPGGMGGGGGVNTPLGTFAQQYQQNQASIASQQFNPYVAQAMAGMSGQQGYQPGMLPSPIQMTAPSMGLFRPFAPPVAPAIPPMPQMPLFNHPLTPSLPQPQFTSPFEYQHNAGIMRGDQVAAAALAAPGVAGRVGADVGASMFGAGVGAYMGGRAFGRGGAIAGGFAGMAAGFMGSEHLGVGRGVQQAIDAVNPFRTPMIRSAQMHTMSQDFVVGGSNLGPLGRGMSARGAAHTSRMLEDVAFDPGFRKETGGMFGAQDMMRLTRMSGEAGMLNMSQSPTEIRDQVKTLAKNLKVFMQVAGEPDVREAIKAMANLRTMGLGITESVGVAQNARMYAKMAGTTLSGIFQAGQAGAAMFQQQGLSAATGLEAGMGAAGMAHQAVAAGSYTPRQLAMLGGTQGIAQREVQSNLAMLKIPMMAMGVSTVGAGGTFGLDARSVGALASGKTNIGGLANQSIANLSRAVDQHGIGAIGMAQMQQTELQDQLGSVLGPHGMQQMRMQQVMNTMKMLNVKGPGGFATAAQAMGLDADMTKQMMGQMNNPEYFSNVDKHIQRQRYETRASAEGTFQASRTRGLGRMMSTGSSGAGQVLRGMRGLSEAWGGLTESLSSTFSSSGEDRAMRDAGMTPEETNRELMYGSRGERRAINELTQAERDVGMRSLRGHADKFEGTSASYSVRGVGIGASRSLRERELAHGGNAAALSYVREAEGGFSAAFGGGWLERGMRGSRGAGNAALDMFSNFGGGAVALGGGAAGEAIRDIARRGMTLGSTEDTERRATAIGALAKQINTGMYMSRTEREDIGSRNAKTLFKGDPKASEKYEKFERSLSLKMAKAANNQMNRYTQDGALMPEHVDAALEAAAKEAGLDPSEVKKVGGVVEAATRRAAFLSANETAFNPKASPLDAQSGYVAKNAFHSATQQMDQMLFGKVSSITEAGSGASGSVAESWTSGALSALGMGDATSGALGKIVGNMVGGSTNAQTADSIVNWVTKAATFGGGTDFSDSAEETKTALFSTSPKVGLAAALKAANKTDQLAGLNLSPEEEAAAEKLVAQQGKNKAQMAAMGERFGNVTDKDQQLALFGASGKLHLSHKAGGRSVLGARALGITNDDVLWSSGEKALGAMTDEDLAKLPEGSKAKELALKYRSGTAEEKAAAGKAYNQLVDNKTEALGTKSASGGRMGNEKQLDIAEALNAGTREAADEVFPLAVKTFYESSVKLSEAADRLGRPTDGGGLLEFLIPAAGVKMPSTT